MPHDKTTANPTTVEQVVIIAAPMAPHRSL